MEEVLTYCDGFASKPHNFILLNIQESQKTDKNTFLF